MERDRLPGYSAAWQRLVRVVSRRSLRRAFRGVEITETSSLRDTLGERSVVFAANHTNWWDGFVLVQCVPLFPRHSHRMIQEARHLERYPFFRWAGLFPLDRAHPRAGLDCAVRMLSGGTTALWMFPQGVLRDESKPIVIERGAEWIACKADAVVVPVGIAYVWGKESRPTVRVSFGMPLSRPGCGELETAMRHQHERARAGGDGFQRVVGGRASWNGVWDGFWDRRRSSKNG